MSTKQKTLKQQAVGRKDIFNLAPESIKYDLSWNERNQSKRIDDHIAALARSITEVGVLQPLTVRMMDGEAWVTDGFCRIQAVHLAIKNGADIKGIPCQAEDRYANEADYVLSMLTRNSGLPFSTIEQAFVVKRLYAYGWSKKDIQAKTGFSITHINTIEDLLAAPPREPLDVPRQ